MAQYGLRASTYHIASGTRGIMQTVALMRQLVEDGKKDPVLRDAAAQLVSFLPQKAHTGEIETLFYFVRDRIRYVQDIYDVETLNTPRNTLEYGYGDCDDKATLLATLLETIGFPTMFKLAGYTPGGGYEHVYVALTTPEGELLHLDATEPEEPGYEPPGAVRELYVE